MEAKLSKYIAGFRKAHETQHSLITMLEKWKSVLDKGEYICCLFMDLSKAFDTINYDLLLAKLKAYGFSKKPLALMYGYLSNRKQRTQINNYFFRKKVIAIDLFIDDLFLFLTQCFLYTRQ